MELAAIAAQYQHAFARAYAERLLPSHRAALAAIGRCRTPAAGELHLHCQDCAQEAYRPLSCGHRSCPKCQHHEASQWLDRQQAKLLPVDYFMVTFTLPQELRALACQPPRRRASGSWTARGWGAANQRCSTSRVTCTAA